MITSSERPHRARRTVARAGLGLLVGMATVLGTALAADAHGYIGGDSSDITGRAAIKSNPNLGPVQWEPQSVEGPKGFPEAGPADGTIASGGNPRFHNLDEQSPTRWIKNTVTTPKVDVGWVYTAPHATAKWHYYVTKQGWDQNAPLRRDELEKVAEFPHDGSMPSNGDAPHRITLPADRSGYHLLLGVWDIADTSNAFYQVADIDIIKGRSDEPPLKPSAPIEFKATASSDSTVSMSWKPPTTASGEMTYVIERLDPTGGYHQVGTTSSLRFTDTGLSPSTMYHYHVLGVTAEGERWPASTEMRIVTHPSDPGALNEWNATATYLVNDVVTYQGRRYLCLQSYQGQGDPGWINAPSLWKLLD